MYDQATGSTSPYTGEFEVAYTGEAQGSIEANVQKHVLVTNTRRTGDLTVQKHVISSDENDKTTKKFTFTVELSDKSVNHSHGSIQFQNGKAVFELAHGQALTIPHLPVGMGYTITETGADGFTTVIRGATGDSASDANRQITGVLAEGENNIIYNNEYITASIALTKSVKSPSAADDNREFIFALRITDAAGNTDSSINGDFEAKLVTVDGTEVSKRITITNGVMQDTIVLKRGESFYIDGLKDGSYVHISESAVTENGVTLFPALQHTVQVSSASATPVLATFENVRATGELKVSKTVESVYNADHTHLYEFTVTLDDATVSGQFGDMLFTDGVAKFTLLSGAQKTASGLPQGVGYTVEEVAIDGMLTTKTGDSGVITSTQAHAQFTNTRQVQAGLRVTKTVTSSNALDLQRTFEVKVEIPELDQWLINNTVTAGEMTFVNGVATLQVQDGSVFEATGLPAGAHYTVTETSPDGFTTTVAHGVVGTQPETVNGLSASGALANGQVVVVALHNTRTSVADLEITKSVISRYETDKTTTPYTFVVDLQQDINATYPLEGGGSAMFVNGVAEVTITGEGSAVIKGLPTGIRYKVTEKPLPGFAVNPREATGEIPLSGKVTAPFTNTRQTGELVVRKTLVSVLEEDTSIAFPFTVTLSDSRINGTFRSYTNGSQTADAQGVTFQNGVATFYLKDGESKRIEYLPVGIGYTVTEQADARFSVTKNGDTGTIEAGVTKTASFVNTNMYGGLLISKTVTSDLPADMDRDYHMVVELGSKETVTYGDVTFTNGVATFTLRHGQSKLIPGLPAGVEYTVMEGVYGADGEFTGYAGEFEVVYREDSNLKDQMPSAPGDGQDVSEANVWKSVEVYNTRKEGSIKIKKVVVSDDASDDAAAFTFTITLFDPDTGNVETGIHGVYDGSLAKLNANAANNTVTFTNGVAQITLKDDEEQTISGLPVGLRYKIQETNVSDHFVVTIIGAQSDVPDMTDHSISGPVLATPSQIIFSNEHKEGSLAIVKSLVSPSIYDVNREFTFHIELLDENGSINTAVDGSYAYEKIEQGATRSTGDGSLFAGSSQPTMLTVTNGVSAAFTLKEGESIYIRDLPIGKVRIVEQAETQNGVEIFAASEQTVAITAGANEQTVVYFNNVRETGSLTVSKTVDSPYNSDKAKKYSFRVTLLRTEGSQTVIASGVSGTFGDMVFENGVSVFDLADGMKRIATGLPAGAKYMVEETLSAADQQLFDTTSTGATGIVPAEANGSATAAFNNSRKVQAGLRVTKTVVSDNPQDMQKVFTVRVTMLGGDNDPLNGTYGQMTFTNGVATLQVQHGSSFAAWGLPVGSKFTVEEETAEGFTSAIALTTDTYPQQNVMLSGAASSAASQSGTINANQVMVAAITNTRQTGSLEVAKKVISRFDSDADAAFSFTVQLDPAIKAGTYGNMTFDETGKATFTLKHGQSMKAEGLPYGVAYRVTEAAVNGFEATWTGRTGTISDQAILAECTNTRKLGSPSDALLISKTVISPLQTDMTRPFLFDVELSLPTVTGEYPAQYGSGMTGLITFDQGKAVVQLRSGESVRIHGLPIGVTCKVTERMEANFTTTLNGPVQRTLSAGGTHYEFTNTRKTTASLTVTKTVAGAAASPNDVFTFEVHVAGLKDGTYGSTVFVNEKAEVFLKHGEQIVITNLPLGAAWEVTEVYTGLYTPEEPFICGVTTEAGNTAAFVNVLNKLPTVPQTGDNSKPVLWAVLLVLSLAGLVSQKRRLAK